MLFILFQTILNLIRSICHKIFKIFKSVFKFAFVILKKPIKHLWKFQKFYRSLLRLSRINVLMIGSGLAIGEKVDVSGLGIFLMVYAILQLLESLVDWFNVLYRMEEKRERRTGQQIEMRKARNTNPSRNNSIRSTRDSIRRKVLEKTDSDYSDKNYFSSDSDGVPIGLAESIMQEYAKNNKIDPWPADLERGVTNIEEI